VALYNFKLVIRFVFSSYLIPLLLITIFLFQIIYKITIVFRFHPLSIFSSLRFSSHSFYWYLFIFNHFLNWICLSISSLIILFHFIFMSNLVIILLIAICFT
jgi:hypothetical protein